MSDENRTEAVLTTTGEVLVKQSDGSFRKVDGQTDWKRLETMDDEDIRAGIDADPDAEATDTVFWERAKVVMPQPKQTVTICLDADILEWFRQERGYQTRINAILRAYYEAHHAPR